MEAATELASVRVNEGASEQEVASVVKVLIVPNLFWLLLLARLTSKMLEKAVLSVRLLDVLDCRGG